VTWWTVETFGTATMLKAKAIAALKPDVVYDETTGRVSAVFEVKAATLRQATDAALRHARELLPVKPAELTVRTTQQHAALTEHPAQMDLVSLGDAAELLGVSPTRVVQLWQTRSDFPDCIARPRSGPIWTRASLEAFKARRDHNRGRSGRPRKTSQAAAIG
jgi:hypothetical protein